MSDGKEPRWRMLRTLSIGFLVTIMTSNTDLEFLTQQQIDKVCKSMGSTSHVTERSLRHRRQFHRDG